MVSSISPNAISRGSAKVLVTITGAGFKAGATVSFNDANIALGTVTVVNTKTITVPVTVGASTTIGSYNVTVTNTDGGTATATGGFTITTGPTVVFVSPNTKHQGSVQATVTIRNILGT